MRKQLGLIPIATCGFRIPKPGQPQRPGWLSEPRATVDSAYEMGHIRKLQAQHLRMQEKTFTNWINNVFQRSRVGLKIQHLSTELADGTHLLRLLELISDEALPPPSRGRLRVHFLENSSRALAFLRAKVPIPFIGPENIMDGDQTFILGLIWVIILRFQISHISQDREELGASAALLSAKEALLLWCQRKTACCANVDITDFSRSWSDGLGFSALIHAHRPDLLDYGSLHPDRPMHSLDLAFRVAEQELGIAQLLDPEDVAALQPDERSIMTYVSLYYHCFSRLRQGQAVRRRLAKVLLQLQETEALQTQYERQVADLLHWIAEKQVQLKARDFPDSLPAMCQLLVAFASFRTQEKPPWLQQRGATEALLFQLQTALRAQNRRPVLPREGLGPAELSQCWASLEQAEASQSQALHQRLLQLKRLETLARCFQHKAALQESFLTDTEQVMDQAATPPASPAAMEVAAQRLGMLEASVLSQEGRFQALAEITDILQQEQYHSWADMAARQLEITRRWERLLERLQGQRKWTAGAAVLSLLREVETASSQLKELQLLASSTACGEQLAEVMELLQRQDLLEAQVVAHGARMSHLAHQTAELSCSPVAGVEVLQVKAQELTWLHQSLGSLARDRRALLEQALQRAEFLQDCEKEEAWLRERRRLVEDVALGQDLGIAASLQKHKALEAELRGHQLVCADLQRRGRDLALGARWSPTWPDPQEQADTVQDAWQQLRALAAGRGAWRQAALLVRQYFADAEEVASWLQEQRSALETASCELDPARAQALLLRHLRLERAVRAFGTELQRLDQQARAAAACASLMVRTFPAVPAQRPPLTWLPGEALQPAPPTGPDTWELKDWGGCQARRPVSPVVQQDPQVVSALSSPEEGPGSPGSPGAWHEVPCHSSTQKMVVPAEPDPDLNPNTILQTQDRMRQDYEGLRALAEDRARLEEAVALFGFYGSCAGLRSWLEKQTALLHARQPQAGTSEVVQLKLENFLTALTVGRGHWAEVSSSAEKLKQRCPGASPQIQQQQEELSWRWGQLEALKKEKEVQLALTTGVCSFLQECGPTQVQLQDMILRLEALEPGHSEDSRHVLQLAQQKLPVLERTIHYLKTVAIKVQESGPTESQALHEQVETLQGLLERMQQQVAQQAQAQAQQSFLQESQRLLQRAEGVQAQLRSEEQGVDVASAQWLLVEHQDLLEDVHLQLERMQQLESRGQPMAALGSSDSQEVTSILRLLDQQSRVLKAAWEQRQQWLQEGLELQKFGREVDVFSANCANYEAFLQLDSLGEDVGEAQSLLQQHQEFGRLLGILGPRAEALWRGKELAQSKHPAAPKVREQLQSMQAQWTRVQEKSDQRRRQLLASLQLQEWKQNVAEVMLWMEEKEQMVADEPSPEPSNILRKLKWHEKAERELLASRGHVEGLQQVGRKLLSSEPRAQEDVQARLRGLSSKWEELNHKTAARGEQLLQARQQDQLRGLPQDAKEKVEQLEGALQSVEMGQDLSSSRRLQKQHRRLESESQALASQMAALASQAHRVANSWPLAEETQESLQRCSPAHSTFTPLCVTLLLKSLQGHLATRHLQLQASADLCQFCYLTTTELTWVAEHMPSASPASSTKCLDDARSLCRTHENLRVEMKAHQGWVLVLGSGRSLAAPGHPQAQHVAEQCQELEDRWAELEQACEAQAQHLQRAAALRQHFLDLSELEDRVAEKWPLVRSQDLGGDEAATVRLIEKHQALQQELALYRSTMEKLDQRAQVLGDPEAPEQLGMVQERVRELLRALQELAATRDRELEGTLRLHEFTVEAEELQDWLAGQTQVARGGEGLGEDHERVLHLCTKFAKFQHQVEMGRQRVATCQGLAVSLLECGHSTAPRAQWTLQGLRAARAELWELTQARGQLLQDAEITLKVHRDLAEMLTQVQEKTISLPSEVAGDLRGLEAQMRRHKGLEHELAGTERQLQELLEAAGTAQQLGPAPQAQAVQQRQQALVQAWEALKLRVEQRRAQLEQACLLARFHAEVQSYTSWADGVWPELQVAESSQEASSGPIKLDAHHPLQAELEAQEELYQRAAQRGQQALLAAGAPVKEVWKGLRALQDRQEQVFRAWGQKQERLRATHQEQLFLRTCGRLEEILTAQEVSLRTSALGSSVEEVERLICKHEIFQKVLTAQDEKEAALRERAETLRGPRVQHRLHAVLERRARVKGLAETQRQALHASLQMAGFTRLATQAEDWIQEQVQRLGEPLPPGGLKDKLRHLQKHQAFQAEVQAHEEVIISVVKEGELLTQSHPQAGEVSQRLRVLQEHWEKLRQALALRGQDLEDMQNFLEFLQRADLCEAWIQEMEVTVNIGDLGQNREHCLQLLKRLQGFRGVWAGDTVDDTRIRGINDSSLHLKNWDSEQVRAISQRRHQLNSRWNSFHGNLLRYQRQLKGALEIHALSCELDVVTEQVREKAARVWALDCGKDLESVQRLLWRHGALEQEVGLVQAQVESLHSEVGLLCQRSPQAAHSLSCKQQEIMDSWVQLRSRTQKQYEPSLPSGTHPSGIRGQKALVSSGKRGSEDELMNPVGRRESLDASHQAQKLWATLRELWVWARELRAEMDAWSAPHSPTEARRMLEEHQEHRAELDSRTDSISLAWSTGQQLLAAGHLSDPDLRQALAGLDQELNGLEGDWQEHQLQLQPALELQLLLSSVEQVESWLCSQEACPASEALGDPLANVETLLWKHKALEWGLEAQAAKISTLEAAAHSLHRAGCPEAQSALGRCQAMLLRIMSFPKGRSQRRRLQELQQLQPFLQDAHEVATWLRDKNLVALEEGPGDPTMLQAQLREQQTLQAELRASVRQQQRLQLEGQRLLQGGHPASETIQECLQELGDLWDELQANCQRKAAKLQEACEDLHLRRSVEELESWLEPVEVELSAPTRDQDQPGLEELLGAQGEQEAAVGRQARQAQALLGQAQAFTQEGRCLAQGVEEQARRLLQKSESLREPLRERRAALEVWSLLWQFRRDAEEEMAWVQEKLPLVDTQDDCQSLSTLWRLQEKHQNLEREMSSHEALIQAVVSTGRKLVQARHFAAHDVAAQVQRLEDAMGHLRAGAVQRRRQLQQAWEVQQFLMELLEAESWLAEKGCVLDSEDMGQSAEATQAFLRQLEATQRDLEGFGRRMERLQQTVALLESRRNPERPQGLARMRAVREAHSGLLQRADGRGQRLREQLQLHQLEQKALLLDAWLASKAAIAESQDYGQDLETITVLEEKFGAFREEVQGLGQAKVQALRELASSLERSAPRCRPWIQVQRSCIEAAWERLDRAIKACTENLAAAREVCGFQQAVAELQRWMQEKTNLMSGDTCDLSLSAVQTLQQQHRRLERKLAAVEKQVAQVRTEACRLGLLQPSAQESLAQQLSEVQEAWARLAVMAQERGRQLQQAAQSHTFLRRCQELLAWAQEKQVLVSSAELAVDLAGAERLLEQHEELGREIKEHCLQAQGVQQEGQLVDNGHFMFLEVTECLQELERQLRALEEAWALRCGRCQESWGLQRLQQGLEQAEAWLASQEDLLLDPNCGHSVSDVELLLRRHQDLEKLLAAQEEKFVQLQRKAGMEPKLLQQNMASTAALDFVGAPLERPRDHDDRKHTPSSRLSSRMETLFAAPSRGQAESWHGALGSVADSTAAPSPPHWGRRMGAWMATHGPWSSRRQLALWRTLCQAPSTTPAQAGAEVRGTQGPRPVLESSPGAHAALTPCSPLLSCTLAPVAAPWRKGGPYCPRETRNQGVAQTHTHRSQSAHTGSHTQGKPSVRDTHTQTPSNTGTRTRSPTDA
ncbi:LOW QUALITY PROTEIN: spectrin beta chain, non-erythrocytic 5 [Glossophaga mutica]